MWDIKRDYLRELVQDYPVISLRQLERLAGSSFSPEVISDVMHEFEEDGTLIKGFLVDDLQAICLGRLYMLAWLTTLK